MFLESVPDLELINRVKQFSCDQSVTELIRRHSGICLKIFLRYARTIAETGKSANDLFEDKDYVINLAVMSYDETKRIKFSTWLGNYARYYCLNYINRQDNFVFLDETVLGSYHEKQTQQDYQNNQTYDQVKHYLSQFKDKRIDRIFRLRYFNGSNKLMSYKEIGKLLKCSPQTILNLHNKAKKIIAYKLKTNSYEHI